MVPHTWPLRVQGQLVGKKTQVSGVETPGSLIPASNPGEAASAASGCMGQIAEGQQEQNQQNVPPHPHTHKITNLSKH